MCSDAFKYLIIKAYTHTMTEYTKDRTWLDAILVADITHTNLLIDSVTAGEW